MTDYVKVCDVQDLTIGIASPARVDGRLLAIVRTGEREVHAVDDTCTHAQVSLSEGEVDCDAVEIETGEIVGAGHASATGRFDDEQLFYLQARGIPEDEARRLVVRGFLAEIVARIGVPELEAELTAAIEAEMDAATGAASAETVDA